MAKNNSKFSCYKYSLVGSFIKDYKQNDKMNDENDDDDKLC